MVAPRHEAQQSAPANEADHAQGEDKTGDEQQNDVQISCKIDQGPGNAIGRAPQNEVDYGSSGDDRQSGGDRYRQRHERMEPSQPFARFRLKIEFLERA